MEFKKNCFHEIESLCGRVILYFVLYYKECHSLLVLPAIRMTSFFPVIIVYCPLSFGQISPVISLLTLKFWPSMEEGNPSMGQATPVYANCAPLFSPQDHVFPAKTI